MQRIPPYSLESGFDLVRYTTPGSAHQPFQVVLEHASERYCVACAVNHPVKFWRQRRIHDVPYDGHPVVLLVTEGRWRCPVTRQRHELAYDVDRLCCTPALRHYLSRQRGRMTVRALAQETGLSSAKISRLQQQDRERRPEPEPVRRVARLGLDDIYIQQGQHLIAVDIDTQRVLALQRVGTVSQGRAGDIDVAAFLRGVPEADIVALDLHPGQYAAARQRWPEATLVIDKRHLLAIIDREVLEQAARVVLDWHAEDDDPLSAQRVIGKFGAAAYPYLALRTLVLRRHSALTAADHVMWSLLRRQQGEEGRLLWEMYQWREALYDLYDRDRRDPDTLTTWLRALQRWQAERRPEARSSYRQPLGRIRWALETYPDACAAYLHTGVTNAATERANARVRRVLRQGHRYDLQTIIDLVNEDGVPALPLYARTVNVVRPGMVIDPRRRKKPMLREAALPEDVTLPAPVDIAPLKPPMAAPAPALIRPPNVPARHLKRQHPELQLPAPVWVWLHSASQPGKRGSERWTARISALASPDAAADWAILNSGGVENSAGDPVPEEMRLSWRTTVLYRYALNQQHELAASVRAALCPDAEIDTLCIQRPLIAGELEATLIRLCAGRFVPPAPQELALLQVVRQAHADPAGDVIPIWDTWCSAALATDTGRNFEQVRRIRSMLPGLTPQQIEVLLVSVRWEVAQEIVARSGLELSSVLEPTRGAHAAWFQRLHTAWQKNKGLLKL